MTNLEYLLLASAVIYFPVSLVTGLHSRRDAQRLERATAGVQFGIESARSDRDAVLGGKYALRMFYSIKSKRVESQFAQLNQSSDVPSRVDIEHGAGKEGRVGLVHLFMYIGALYRRDTRMRSTFAGEHDLHRKVRAVQEQLFVQGRITLVNLVDGFDKAPLAALNKAIKQLELEIGSGYTVPVEAIFLIEESVRKNQQQRDARHLSESESHFAIRASYVVSEGPREGSVTLRASWGTFCTVLVTVRCDSEWLGEGGSEEMRIGETITATCLGVIERWDPDRKELTMSYTSIYRF